MVYHYQVGTARFQKTGAICTVLSSVVGNHMVLAAAVPPLAIITLSRGLRAKYKLHRRIARWTLPVRLYVGVTGVVVYWMLYRL